MKKKTHQDRIALIDRLEKKYSQKIQFQRLRKQEKYMKQTLRTVRGIRIENGLEYEVADATLPNGHRLAY